MLRTFTLDRWMNQCPCNGGALQYNRFVKLFTRIYKKEAKHNIPDTKRGNHLL